MACFGCRGYKTCDRKCCEAFEEFDHLDAELTQPGKLVAGFRELLNTWEPLRSDVTDIEARLGAITAFFADAPDDLKDAAGIRSLEDKL